MACLLRSSSSPVLVLDRRLLVAFVATNVACSAAPHPEPVRQAVERGPERAQNAPVASTTAAASAPVSPAPEEVPKKRFVLGNLAKTNLPTSVEPVTNERAALLVSQAADERESYVRWIDEAGKTSPIVRLVDEYVVTAYGRADGKRELVTSNGERMCIARFVPDADKPEARACAKVEAKAIAVLGEKLAVISLEQTVKKIPVEKPLKPAAKPAQPAAKKKPAPPKKKSTTTNSKKKAPEKKAKVEKKPEVIRREVKVLAQWATSDAFGEAKKTGLVFSPPLEGMTIVDAKGSARGVELVWFERTKPTKKSKPVVKGPPPIGFASIQTGLLQPDGTFDPASKKLVVEGDLDWGFLRGFSGPKLVSTKEGPALLTQRAARNGPCEVTKIADGATMALPANVCGIDPGALGDSPVFESILRVDPRRRQGQPKYDPELVVWAGDQAFFVTNEGRAFHSAKRDGAVQEEPAPFPAKRARMTSAELERNGSGWAVVDGQTYFVNAAGEVRLDEALGKTKRVLASLFREFDRHSVPLPGGGVWTSDRERTKVVWRDERGREQATAAWPEGESAAFCADGLPGKKFVPAPTPGQFVEVPELAVPGTCVVSDPVWAADGSLRWFGTYREGLDVLPEVRILPNVGKTFTAPKEDAEPKAANPAGPCPPEMVLVDGKLCVDRFEATIVEVESGRVLSPDFPVTPNLFENALSDWATGRSRMGSVHARAMPLPFLPEWQRGKKIEVMAISRPHSRPNGYLTGLVAESACAAAGKRLCTLAEFVLACRGEDDTQFPYGDTYVDGVCNVNRDQHPAAILHDNASIGHLDPRLNRVRANGATLLRETGATPNCRSRWGKDAIYDLVGNLDEWVDEDGGAFAGGFYARSTRSGCEAVITAHPKNYLDYSTGVRCCKDAGKN